MCRNLIGKLIGVVICMRDIVRTDARSVSTRFMKGHVKYMCATLNSLSNRSFSKRLLGVAVLTLAVAAQTLVAQSAQNNGGKTALLVGVSEVCAGANASVPAACTNAISKAGHVPVVICRGTRDEIDRAVSRIDLLLLPGGEDVDPARYGAQPSPALGRVNKTRDEFEEQVLRSAVRHEVPIVGICRGEQRLNVFFGGTLYQDLPSELGKNYTVEHRSGKPERRHSIVIAEGSRLAKVCGTESVTVNSSHHQAAKRLAPGMTDTAWSNDGVVEAIECDWYPAAGVQFHPERLSAVYSEPIWDRFFAGIIDFAGRKPNSAPARRPIGVVVSDSAGLAVLERFLTIDEFDNATGEKKKDGKPDFAGEDFVLLGDFARGPYDGRYAAAGNGDVLAEMVVRDAQFLLGGAGHEPVKALVVAAGNAATAGVERVRAMARPHDAFVTGTASATGENADDSALSAVVECYRSLRQSGLLQPDGGNRAAARVHAFITELRSIPYDMNHVRGRRSGIRIVPLSNGELPLSVKLEAGKTFPACAKELGL